MLILDFAPCVLLKRQSRSCAEPWNAAAPQHFLYFFPLPHEHSELGLGFFFPDFGVFVFSNSFLIFSRT